MKSRSSSANKANSVDITLNCMRSPLSSKILNFACCLESMIDFTVVPTRCQPEIGSPELRVAAWNNFRIRFWSFRISDLYQMNYPAAELTGYQTALTALFFEAKLRGIHPKGLKKTLKAGRNYAIWAR